MAKEIAFHGFELEDWVDELFVVELRFGRPPDDEALKRLGAAWVRWTGAQEVHGWEIGGTFAYATFVPHRSREQQCLQALREWVEAHGDGIEEATVLGVPLEQPLDPGPAYPGSPRPVDTSLSKPGASPAFDAGAAEGRAALAEHALAGLLADANKQRIGLESAAPAPPPPAATDWFCALGNSVQPALQTHGQLVGWLYELDLERYGSTEGYQPCFATNFALQDDHALVGVQEMPLRYTRDNSATVLLRLQSDSLQELWRSPDEDQGFHSIIQLDDHIALVRTNTRLLVVDWSDQALVAQVKGKFKRICVGERARLVAVERSNGVSLFAWSSPKLKRLATYKHKELCLANPVDDHIRLRVGSHHLALVGTEDIFS